MLPPVLMHLVKRL